MRRWRTWAIAAVVVLAVVAAAWVWRRRTPAIEATSFTQVMAVERGSLVAAVTLTGEVAAKHRAELSFDVTRVPLLELRVAAGQQVNEGDVLARIDPAPLQRAVDQAEADLLSAEDALAEAEAPYSDLDRQKAELDVALAEATLQEAQQSLQEFLDPEQAQKALSDATRVLQEARDRLPALQSDPATQEQLDRLQYQANVAEVEHGKLLDNSNPTEESRDRQLLAYNRMMDAQDSLETAQARAALDLLNAQNEVAKAEEELADLLAGTDSLAQAQARNKAAQADYNLARAKDSLSTILAGPDPKAVQLAQSRRDAAKATLEDAQAALNDAIMIAPFDATVISVGPDVGDLVSSNTTIVTLADLSNLQITAIVDETDISQIEVGQEAQVTFDAFPGRRLSGKVLEVPLEGQLIQNIVTYEVPVSMELVQGLAIRPGMTANLSIVVGRRENALLIPALAVLQSDQGNVVLIQDSPQGAGTTTPVEIGLSDGTYVEVLRGLNEGDRVLVEYQASNQQDQFRGFGMIIQGGPPAGEQPGREVRHETLD